MMSRDEGLRIVLIEDHVLFAESLTTVLRMDGYDARRLALEGLSGSSTQLLSKVAALRPDVAFVDLELGSLSSGMDLIRPLSESGVVVMVVTGDVEKARWGECVENGAAAVFTKFAAIDDIVTAVRRVANGLPTMTPEERTHLLRARREQVAWERVARRRLAMLTRREAEVLGMLMEGMQVGDIARARFVSESTVRTQVKAVLAKLQVGSQLTAVGLAHKARWAPPATIVPSQRRPAENRAGSPPSNHQR